MVQAVQEISVNEGVDPRDCLIVAGGGAAGLNMALVVKELGASKVLIPRTAGGLSACGAQYSDIISEFSSSCLLSTRDFNCNAVNQILGLLDAKIDVLVKDLAERGITKVERTYFTEARYEGQVWELPVRLRAGRFESPDDVKCLVEDFHAVHQRVFAVTDRGSEVEALVWKARLTALVDKPSLVSGGGGFTSEPRDQRPAHFPEVGEVKVACYDGPSLAIGTRIAGPAIIEEPTTTIVVYPNMVATVTSLRNYMIETGT
jgi:N-methylhydantoinase A